MGKYRVLLCATAMSAPASASGNTANAAPAPSAAPKGGAASSAPASSSPSGTGGASGGGSAPASAPSGGSAGSVESGPVGGEASGGSDGAPASEAPAKGSAPSSNASPVDGTHTVPVNDMHQTLKDIHASMQQANKPKSAIEQLRDKGIERAGDMNKDTMGQQVSSNKFDFKHMDD